MKTLMYTLLLLALVSCEKEIPLDTEVTDPKLVINCGFEEGEQWDVHLSQSLSVIDNGNLLEVEGATVNILDENGVLVETLTDGGNGYYWSTSTVGPVGTNYRIEAIKTNFEKVEASNTVPPHPNIIFKDTVSTTYLGEDVFEITFDLNDPGGREDYYLIQLMGVYDDTSLTGGTEFYDLWFNVNAPEFDNTSPDQYNRIAFLKDSQIDGTNYSITARVFRWFSQSNLESIIVRVTSCTEEAFNYKVSYEEFIRTSGDPFSQPVQVYSNVTNGFGIFAGYATDTIAVDY